MLEGSGHDKDGEWTVKFKVPKTEGPALIALSFCTEKALKVRVTPPSADTIFGRIAEE